MPASALLSQFDARRANELCKNVLAEAGVTVGGSEPWDIEVKDERLYQRLLRDGFRVVLAGLPNVGVEVSVKPVPLSPRKTI